MLFGLASAGSNAVQVLIQHTYKTHRHAGRDRLSNNTVHYSQQYIYIVNN